MDKIDKIKFLIRTSLDTSFGGGFLIKDIHIQPTQKFNEQTSEWIPDSYSIFLTIEDKRTPEEKPDFYHFLSDDPRHKISSFLEDLLGFEVCAEIVSFS